MVMKLNSVSLRVRKAHRGRGGHYFARLHGLAERRAADYSTQAGGYRLIMKAAELFTEHPIAHQGIVLCPPPTEKTFRNDRTAALSIEILARARPKSNDLSTMMVALLCVVIILTLSQPCSYLLST
jgi:hypothetical protein